MASAVQRQALMNGIMKTGFEVLTLRYNHVKSVKSQSTFLKNISPPSSAPKELCKKPA
jgi:hypothetical protein